MPSQPYDYSPLTDKITLGQLFSFDKLSIGLKFGIGIAAIVLILPIIAVIASPAMRQGGLYIIAIFFGAIGVIVASMLVHRIKYIKLQRFAYRNQMTMTRGIDLVHRHGAPFQMQIPTNDSIALANQDANSIEIGNFIARDRNGMPSAYGSFGFIRFVLPREFPHIVLDAKSSDVVTRSTAAPLSYYVPEVIKLEGDFSNTFHVYAPSNYGSDLRYILPPDFMACLVDNASSFDIEITGNELYLYNVNFFTMANPVSLEEVFTYAHHFQQSLQKYLVPYTDWRTGSHTTTTVAPMAKQLSQATPKAIKTLAMLIIGIVVYYLARHLIS